MIVPPELTSLTYCEVADRLCAYDKAGVVYNMRFVGKAVCVGCFYMHAGAELAGLVFGGASEEKEEKDDE